MMIRIGPAFILQKQVGIRVMAGEGIIEIGTHAFIIAYCLGNGYSP